MRYWLALVLFASSVSAQNVDKTVEVQVQKAPTNPTKLLQTDQGRGAGIEGAKLSPDGRLVAIYGDVASPPNRRAPQWIGWMQIWDVAARKKLHDLAGHRQKIKSVVWSHDGKHLVSQSYDGQILLWDAQNSEPLFALSPAQPQISLDERAKMTSVQKLRAWAKRKEQIELIGFSSDDRVVYARSGRVELPLAVQKILNADVEPTDEENALAVAALWKDISVLRAWKVADGAASESVDFAASPNNTYNSHGRLMTFPALSADGRSFSIISNLYRSDKTHTSSISRYDLQTGALISTLRGDDNTTFQMLSDDGSLALAYREGKNGQTELWDVGNQKKLQLLEKSAEGFSDVFFTADNRRLLVGGRAGDILIYDLASGHIERRLNGGHWGTIDSLDITPDGSLLVSAAYQGNVVNLWDLTLTPESSLQAQILAQDHNLRQISVAPDGSVWLGYGQGEWKSGQPGWDVNMRKGESVELRHISASGEKLETISIPETFLVDDIVFSTDFKLAAGSLRMIPQPGWIKGAGLGVWDVVQKKLLWQLPGNSYLTDVLAFAPDGKTLVSGRGDGIVQLWDMQSGELVRPLFEAGSSIETLTFAPDGQTLAIGNDGGTIQLLDRESGEVRDEVTEDFSPRAVAFSPDGKYLLSGGNIETGDNPIGFKVTLRDLESKKLLHEWSHDKGAQSEVERERLRREDKADGVRYFGGLAFSPDSKLLAFSHFGNPMRIDRAQTEIWDIATNTRVGLIPDRASAQMPTFSSDGKTVFTTDGNWIKSWQLSDVLAQNVRP